MDSYVFKGDKIKLIALNEKYFDLIYKWYIVQEMKDLFIESNKLLSRSELYDYFVKKRFFHTLLLVTPIDSNYPIGCIYSYKYNCDEQFIYIKIFMETGGEDSFIEATKLFCNYLFTYLPIRKIYYEEYKYNKDWINPLKRFKFKLECCLSQYRYFQNEYYDKFILGIFREEFYNEGNK